ncbi:hypothetical protein GEV33_003313 [Tenebrio molitor]|uniref:C2H2-type domain-containing protein n=1 Tax=Tenebrio molitor TaxID=7067 RepID=A0A8J6HSK8_TENMO|nr:hypothetical protein GEV33_003313 [Tenebrio molitor]
MFRVPPRLKLKSNFIFDDRRALRLFRDFVLGLPICIDQDDCGIMDVHPVMRQPPTPSRDKAATRGLTRHIGGGVGPEVEAGQWQVTGTQVHDPPPDGRELVCGNGKALPGTMSWSGIRSLPRPRFIATSDEGGNVLNIVNDGKFLLGACIDFFERSESLHIYLSIYQKGQWDVVAPETPLLGSAEGVKIDPVRVDVQGWVMFLGDEIRVKVRRETKPEVSPGGGGGGAVSRRDKLGEFGLDNFIHRVSSPTPCVHLDTPPKTRLLPVCARKLIPTFVTALDKLGTRHLFSNSAPEPVQVYAAFDIASLVLYGCQALPIRLKILLDRVFSVLRKEQVLQVLHGFGWTAEDYTRGYILQESHGGTLDRWSICSPEEEPLVLQQFLRFGETRAITQQLLLAQQALQDPTLERLERRPSPNLRRAMSPNHRPSHQTVPHSAFHPSRLPTMSPHQKHHLNFLKMPTSNGPLPTNSPPRSVSTSPLNTSPLNRLQNMQPFDFRKLGSGLTNFPNRVSPDLNRRRTLESESVGLNLTMATSLSSCLPPPPPRPPSLSHSAAAMAAAVSVNSLAAASLVASSFPGLMPTRMSTRCKSPSSAEVLSGNNNSEEDDDVDENSYSALNLSRDRDILKAPRQPRAIPGRKPTTPTKRQWGSPGLPLNLGTQFINPATGKKRVQCNVCLKTFCDKGALKIHFSAVHLREMHKCTVEGCNMMFSSRRSRNRHSANPNPKLHSPHLRRKISPHDGRSAQAHPLLIPPQTGLSLPAAAAALNPLNPFGPFPLLTPPPDIRHHTALSSMDFKQTLDLSMQRLEEKKASSIKDYSALSLAGTHQQSEEEEDEDDDGIVVVGGDEEEEPEKNEVTNGISSDQPEDFSMPSKRPKMSVSDVEEDMTSNLDSNEDSLSIVDTHSLKDELNVQTNKRKRKSQNPTRCAVPVLMEDAVSDCDSSNDVFSDAINEKHSYALEEKEKRRNLEMKKEEEKNELKCDSPLNLEKRCPDVNANEPEKVVSPEIKKSLAPLFMIDKLKKEKPSHEAEPVEENDERPASIWRVFLTGILEI